MNEKGIAPLILMIILAIAAIFIIPPIVLYFFPIAKYLFQIAMIFMIYMMVKGFIVPYTRPANAGENVLTLIISAILIYFLVFKYTAITASLWVFQTLLMVQFFSMLMWGMFSFAPKPH